MWHTALYKCTTFTFRPTFQVTETIYYFLIRGNPWWLKNYNINIIIDYYY